MKATMQAGRPIHQHFESLHQVGASPFKQPTPKKSTLPGRVVRTAADKLGMLGFKQLSVTFWGSQLKGIGAKIKHLSFFSMGGNGQPCFPLPQPSTVQWGVFVLLSVKNATSKKRWFERRMTCTLSILGGCFLILLVDPAGSEFEALLGEAWTRVFVTLMSGLAQHGISVSPRPPSATCLLALSSGPPWPTSKTPRKNIPRHQRNMDLTSFPRWLRSALFNKIKIKNKWKIIMPTRTIRPTHTFQWVIAK